MERIKSKFILDIVPLTKIPLTRNQAFCYIFEENLPPGSLVSIPLFRRNIEGIVVNSRSDFKQLGNIELKKINKVIEKEFLTLEQLELAHFISDYYISPLGIVMKNFVPRRAKARAIKYATYNIKQKDIILTKEQLLAVDKITNRKLSAQGGFASGGKIKNSKFLLFGPSASGKTEVYIHSILKLRKKDNNLQFLILVPEQTLTPQALERYGAHFK